MSKLLITLTLLHLNHFLCICYSCTVLFFSKVYCCDDLTYSIFLIISYSLYEEKYFILKSIAHIANFLQLYHSAKFW